MIKWIFCFLLLVTNVQAKTVTLSWDPSPSPSVIGYSVITSTLPSMLNPSTQDVGGVLTTIVNGLENQDDHYFCVKAYDANGNESVCSNIVNSPPIPEAVLPDLDFTVDVELINGNE